MKLESSDDLRTAYLTANQSQVLFEGSSQVSFTFPMNIFMPQDFVKVSLSFGEDKYFLANDRLFVYTPIVLLKPRPLYLYTSSIPSTREIFIYGSNFWDT